MAEVAEAEASVCVYRAFDGAGRVLYVGISDDWARRWTQHGVGRPALFKATARLEVAWFCSRDEALAAENALIKKLKPPYNAIPPERAERLPRPVYGCDRFLDPDEALPAPPPDLSRKPSRTIAEMATMLDLAPKTVRNLLSEFRKYFEPSTYMQPEGKGYRLRLLSDAEFHTLGVIIQRCEAAGTMPRQEKS